MKTDSHVVEGGGWVIQQTVGKPRARFFSLMSVIWLFASIPASFSFWDGWPPSFGWLEWLCTLVIMPQAVFVVLALVFLLREQPRIISEQQPNPDYDIRKLY